MTRHRKYFTPGPLEKVTSEVRVYQISKQYQRKGAFDFQQNLQNLEISYILMPPETPNFIQQVSLNIQHYQHQKALRLNSYILEPSPLQRQAKQTLMELGEEAESEASDDVEVGRWSSYKVPIKIEERMMVSKKVRRKSMSNVPTLRCLEERNYLPSISRSEKTIPKLKVILNQLQCPLNLLSCKEKLKAPASAKMKNHIGMQALVISKQQNIKPSIKSERKTNTKDNNPSRILNENNPSRILNDSNPSRILNDTSNRQNSRPPSSNLTSYQKIKRTIGVNGDCDLIFEKQILAQLIKNNSYRNGEKRNEQTMLGNMMNYFTKSDGKKKVPRLGLDKILS